MEETKKEEFKPNNSAEKIRKLFFNYDLELLAGKGELDLNKAKIKRYATKKNKKELELYTSSLIEEAKITTYIEQLTKGKNEVYENLEAILKTYTPKYRDIWMMYFISQKTHQEISDATFYSIENVKKVIKKLKNDLISYGIDYNKSNEEE